MSPSSFSISRDKIDAIRAHVAKEMKRETEALRAKWDDVEIILGERDAMLSELRSGIQWAKEEYAALRAENDRLKAALEPILIAGNGSSEGFAELFEEAAEKPLYWTELAKLAQDELAALRAENERLKVELNGIKDVIQWGWDGATDASKLEEIRKITGIKFTIVTDTNDHEQV
jgi:regulator of replication initiation timing